MIIEIYILLLSLSFAFIILGYSLKDEAQIFKILGFTILFIISFMLIPNTAGSLEYVSGSISTETLNGTVTTLENVTTSYENHFIGWALTVCSLFGFVNVFFTMRGSKNE